MIPHKITCRCGRVDVDRGLLDPCDSCGTYDHTSVRFTHAEMQSPAFWRLVWSS